MLFFSIYLNTFILSRNIILPLLFLHIAKIKSFVYYVSLLWYDKDMIKNDAVMRERCKARTVKLIVEIYKNSVIYCKSNVRNTSVRCYAKQLSNQVYFRVFLPQACVIILSRLHRLRSTHRVQTSWSYLQGNIIDFLKSVTACH